MTADPRIIEIVCTNCGQLWTDDHPDECELRFGVWLEASKALTQREDR